MIPPKTNIFEPQEATNQKGFVSLVVTMIIMVILSLITLGFAQIARREARLALDQQLSTQAFYAAESGVNDALEAIRQHGFGKDKDVCGQDSEMLFSDGVIDAQTDTGYTCLLINQQPQTLEYGTVNQTSGIAVPLNSASGSNIKSLKISWQDASVPATGGFLGNDLFPTSDNFTSSAAVLRAQLIHTDVGSSLTRDNLTNNMFTAFLQPKSGGVGAVGTVADKCTGSCNDGVALAEKGNIVNGGCNTSNKPRHCNVIINIDGNYNNFVLRLLAIYKDAAVTITAYDASGNSLALNKSQIVIDVTGKASDVLRRIQVRVPVKDFDFPGFGIESAETICKRIVLSDEVKIMPSVSENDEACAIPVTSSPPVSSGNADIIDIGGGIDADPKKHYDIALINNSDNQPSIVKGCIWDWGDGHSTTDACYSGDQAYYQYPGHPTHYVGSDPVSHSGTIDRSYSVKLTIMFNDGTPNATTNHVVNMPTWY